MREGPYILASFYCPGCDEMHTVRCLPKDENVVYFKLWDGTSMTKVDDYANKVWSWSYTKEGRFKLSPSYSKGGYLDGNRCHLFLEGGEIKYLRDCDHAFKDKKVRLADIEDVGL